MKNFHFLALAFSLAFAFHTCELGQRKRKRKRKMNNTRSMSLQFKFKPRWRPHAKKTTRECQKISCALRKKFFVSADSKKKTRSNLHGVMQQENWARKRYAFAFGAFAFTEDGRERERKTILKHRLRPPSFISFPESSLPDCCSRVTRTLGTRLPPS